MKFQILFSRENKKKKKKKKKNTLTLSSTELAKRVISLKTEKATKYIVTRINRYLFKHHAL